MNDVDVYWRSQVQLQPHSPFSIRWSTWSASSPRRFTHGERAPGSHFTGGWLEFRAGLSSGKLKILHAWRKKNEVSLSLPIRSLIATETCHKTWTAYWSQNQQSSIKSKSYLFGFLCSGSLLRTKTTK